MKGLNWFDRFLFLLNILFALALLFSYLLPYIPPGKFALLSVFSLGVPLLIIINIIFLLFWLFRLKRQAILSLVVLLLGFNHVTSVYEVSSEEDGMVEDNVLKIMTYNVRQFNQYGWADDVDIPQKITAFMKEQDPDVVAMQEYYKGELEIAKSFPYEYIKLKEKNAEFGLALFSKYPIINSGSLDFPTTSNNNAIYADIVKNGDTVRVLNVHFQSFGIKPNLNNIEKEHSKKVLFGMGQTFVKQERQMKLVKESVLSSPYPAIILGDFNNTAYSYIYRELRDIGFNDAYKEAGNGFGKTFEIFEILPLRIDFILPQESMGILTFQNHMVPYSDHFPITANLRLGQ
ncbi:endonuclease/exonuclease/phosphatase family protein [Salinimicrobium sp. MT39]|uniref:Endonuclease/exonuclease/phosphatase family protein n=1 Tax=Salinimicrobium profundisediminis TaxID=2994553 RepID=A0A9X3CZL9_9FLAO|nr:endonuclease/exonuclease/phosphatase family protein [Salinimicrobium profundisediminis]MCX2839620.1 endonuclease/exonuclease/phosphatase family protein [Salinimicrobium profundisediminis]